MPRSLWGFAIPALMLAVILAGLALLRGSDLTAPPSDDLLVPRAHIPSTAESANTDESPRTSSGHSRTSEPLPSRDNGIIYRGISTVWAYDQSCIDPVMSTVYDCVTRFAEKCAVLSGCDETEHIRVSSFGAAAHSNATMHGGTNENDITNARSKLRKKKDEGVPESIFSLALRSALVRNVSMTLVKCNKTKASAAKLHEVVLAYCDGIEERSNQRGGGGERLSTADDATKRFDMCQSKLVANGSLEEWVDVFVVVNATSSSPMAASSNNTNATLAGSSNARSEYETLLVDLCDHAVQYVKLMRNAPASIGDAEGQNETASGTKNKLQSGDPIPPWCAGQNHTSFRMAFVGDSISIKFPQRIRQWLHAHCSACESTTFWPTFKNYAVSGIAVQRALSQITIFNTSLFNESLEWGPNLVVVVLGSNDGRDGLWLNRSAFKEDFSALVMRYLELESAPIVVVATPPPLFGWQYFNMTRRKGRKVLIQEKKIIGYTEIEWSNNIGEGVVPSIVEVVEDLQRTDKAPGGAIFKRLHLIDLNRILLRWLELEAKKFAVTRAGASASYADTSRPVNQTIVRMLLREKRPAAKYYGSFPLHSIAAQQVIRQLSFDGVHPGKLMQKQTAIFMLQKLFAPIEHGQALHES